MQKKNTKNIQEVEVIDLEPKKSNISTIIKDAYQRTQKHFLRQNTWRNTQMENLQKKLKEKSQKPILIEDNKLQKEPTQIEKMEQSKTKIVVGPLLELHQDQTQCISEPEIISDTMINAETIFFIQNMMNKEKTIERKVQLQILNEASQFNQFQYYEQLKQDDKLKLLDQQIDESFSYTYQSPSSKQSQIKITYFDFTKLNHFVNDTLINFFLRFAQSELVVDVDKIKIYSTYHTAKIIPYEHVIHLSSDDHVELAKEFGKNFSTILKWNKEDIFSKQYVIFPLHRKEHWSLMVVVNPTALCRQLMEGKVDTDYGFFIYFDSLKVLDEKINFFLKIFLLQIYCHQHNITMSQEEIIQAIKKHEIVCCQPLVTRQINYADCGVHLLEYAESFMMNSDDFVQRIKSKNGWNQLDWFPRIMVLTKRLLIKRLLLNLNRYDKDQAVSIYKKERNNILQEFKDKPSEYDIFDEDGFQEYAQEKNGQKQTLRLEFYLSDELNFYYQE